MPTFQEAAANLECGFLPQKPPSNADTAEQRHAAWRQQKGETPREVEVINQPGQGHLQLRMYSKRLTSTSTPTCTPGVQIKLSLPLYMLVLVSGHFFRGGTVDMSRNLTLTPNPPDTIKPIQSTPRYEYTLGGIRGVRDVFADPVCKYEYYYCRCHRQQSS